MEERKTFQYILKRRKVQIYLRLGCQESFLQRISQRQGSPETCQLLIQLLLNVDMEEQNLLPLQDREKVMCFNNDILKSAGLKSQLA